MGTKLLCSDSSIVISGISGRFPRSSNLDEFKENLYNGHLMITHDTTRCPAGTYGLPTYSGKLKNLSSFDNDFFRIPEERANLMDHQLRILMEVTYEAIIDSGLNPNELKKSKTGVFMGSCFQETDLAQSNDATNIPAFRNLYTTQISHFFDLIGPCFHYDTACASSFSALNEAYHCIKHGICDMALVTGYNVPLNILVTFQFFDLKMISPDGISKCLDKRANGFSRSEAVVCVFLQKAKKAKRIYTTIVNSMSTADGYKEQGINFPSTDAQRTLMEKIFEESNIDPNTINYIEAHTTGTQAGDPVEVAAICDVFCKNRKKSLKVGCLKSSMGHSEGTSGLCAIAKCILIFQTLKIPKNLNFNTPNPNIKALFHRSIEPVLKLEDFEGDIIPLNCFGFGGSNVHVILKTNPKRLTDESYNIVGNISRLVYVCGRNQSAVNHIFDTLEKKKQYLCREFLEILNGASKCILMPFRGYLLINKSENGYHFERHSDLIDNSDLYLTFTGLENKHDVKFLKMVITQLSQIEVFALTIERLKVYLTKSNYNSILSQPFTNNETNDVIDYIICLISLQIGLINIFNELKIEYNGLIGFSLGEISCAYAEHYISEREAILYSYITGQFFQEQKISFIDKNNNSIYCPLLDKHQANFLINLLNNVSVIPHQPSKSLKWLSAYNNECAELATFDTLAEYLVHSLTYEAKVNQALKPIKSKSNLLHIGYSQSLNKLLTTQANIMSINYFNILDPNFVNPVDHLLRCFGELYIHGCNPAIENLYPQPAYPVAIDTPNLSSLVKWNYSKDFRVCKFPDYFNPLILKSHYKFQCNLNAVEDWYLSGHKIDERILFPATGYLILAWSALCNYYKYKPFDLRIKFKNVHFYRATILSTSDTRFIVQFIANTGSFLITEEDTKVASGSIYLCSEEEAKSWSLNQNLNKEEDEDDLRLTKEAVYRELKIRGYDYEGYFQNIVQSNFEGTKAKIEWKDFSQINMKLSIAEKYQEENWRFLRTWITFTDCTLQLALLSNRFARELFVPVRIDSLYCNASRLKENIQRAQAKLTKTVDKVSEAKSENEQNGEDKTWPLLDVYYDPMMTAIKLDGMVIQGVNVAQVSRKNVIPCIEKIQFIPNFEDYAIEEEEDKIMIEMYAKTCLHLKTMIEDKKLNQDSHEIDSVLNQDHFDVKDKRYALYAKMKEMLRDKESNTLIDLTTLYDDLLFGTYFLTDQYFYKPLIAKAVEKYVYCGSLRSKLNFAEINTTNFVWSDLVVSHIKHATMDSCHLEYTLAHNQLSTVKNQTQYSVNKVTFDLASESLPPDFVNLDVVMFIFDTKAELNLDQMFNLIVNSLKPNGNLIIIVHELTFFKNFEPILLRNSNSMLKTMVDRSVLKEITSLASKYGLLLSSQRIVHQKYIPSCGMLFVKKDGDLSLKNVITFNVSNDDHYNWVDEVKKELSNDSNQNIWLISKEANTCGLQGMIKCLRLEAGGERVQGIIPRPGFELNFGQIDFEKEPLKSILLSNAMISVYDSNLGWGSYYHLMIKNDVKNRSEKKIRSKNVFLKSLIPGDLTSLTWIHDEKCHNNTNNGTLVSVYYAPLNFKDIMHATGRLPIEAHPGGYKSLMTCDSILGLEYSGIDENGSRVMGMLPFKGLASEVLIKDKDFIWPVKDEWTLEEASTVPVVYCTAYYALIIRGKLQNFESVLIHCGSGGVGFASIRICLSMKCKVFTTVGSEKKREFLKHHFPEINDSYIFNSRDTSFEEGVLRETDGLGVNVILNSLSEEKLQASVRCLANGGRFLEIGKFDFVQNSQLNLGYLDHNKSYEAIMLDNLYTYDDNVKAKDNILRDRKQLGRLIVEGVKKGVVKPLPVTLFEKSQIEDAFRFMATGKHMGKVVIKIREETKQNNLSKTKKEDKFEAIVETKFNADKYYLIVGAFGGLGMELTMWMVLKGAQNLILNSRSGPKESYHHYCLERMKNLNINVLLSSHNLADYDEAKMFIKSIEKERRLGGVFNCALVLNDAAFINQSPETFKQVCEGKLKITQNLNQITQELCPQLDYFVIMSSIVAGRGNPGQTNYAYANSAVENICEKRRKDNLHGLAIQWGYIGDVGFVIRCFGESKKSIRGTAPQRIYSCLKVLDKYLLSPYPIISSLVKYNTKDSSELTEKSDIIKIISHILGIKDANQVDPNLTLSELGIDSLMAIEIKQVLEKEYNISKTTTEIRKLTFGKLIEFSNIIQKSKNNINMEKINKEDVLDLDLNWTQEEDTVRLNQVENGKPVFYLPPITGNFDQLSLLAKLTDRPAIGLIWNKQLINCQDWDTVSSYYDTVIAKYDQDNYDIIAYSFGGLVGLYFKSYLKKCTTRRVQNLILLDSDPIFLSFLFKTVMVKHNISESELKEPNGQLLATRMVRINQKLKRDVIIDKLNQTSNLKERLIQVRKILKENSTNEQQIEEVVNSCWLILTKLKLVKIAKLPDNINQKCIMYVAAKSRLSDFTDNTRSKLEDIEDKHYFEGNHFTFIILNQDSLFNLIHKRLSSN